MATVTPAAMLAQFDTNPVLSKAILESVGACLTMCDIQARCVGLATIPARDPGIITGLIGVHGAVSGFITVNLAEKVAVSAVGGLLQEEVRTLSSQVVDGVGEITNIIAGGIKKGLAGSPWALSHVTVPSVIVGSNYQIAFTKGFEYLAATFEHLNDEAMMLSDRLIQVAVSLIRL